MNAVVQQDLPGMPAPIEGVTPMQLVERAMAAGNLDLVERFMQLQERWEARQALKAFEVAMAAAKAEIRPIVKNREVDFTSARGRTNYDYEDFGQIADQVDHILAKHGLNYRHRPRQNGKSLTIICKMAHRDGHFEEVELTADNDESGNKNSIQSIGSAATYLQRYTVKLALGLATTKDDDGRKAAADEPTITEDQIANLEALLTEVAANKAGFLKVCKIDQLEDMPASKYKEAVRRLEEKRK